MRRIGVLISLCFVMGIAFTGTAQAITGYPAGGSTFDTNSEGWMDVEHSCKLLFLPSTLCSVQNTYDGVNGNPNSVTGVGPGSLRSTYTTAAGALGLTTGTSVYRSPSFTIGGPGPIAGASFQLDRRADQNGALLNVSVAATSTVTLVNEDHQTSTTLLTDAFTAGGFATRQVAVDKSLLTIGEHYHLDITSTFTTTLLQAALGTIDVFYDNVALLVDDGTMKQVPTVTTLPATNITATTATLNSAVNPNGSETFSGYGYGTTASAYTTFVPLPSRDIGKGTTDVTPNSVAITGLTPCTTYHFAADAANANNNVDAGTNLAIPTFGSDLAFTTDCPPAVQTLQPGTTATTATLNGIITARGPAGTYHFEYGTTTAYGTSTPARDYAESRSANGVPVAGEPIGGLVANTTYHVRLVATSSNPALGTTQGNDVAFTTPLATGPTGSPGATGSPGTNGATGTQGIQGVAGVQGATGKTGSSGKNGSDITLQNGKGLLKIKTKIVKVGLQGRRMGQLRLPIFCTKKTGRTCAGTVKIRTINKINPSTTGRHAKRRVTFLTVDYQLKQGAVGVVIGELQPEKLDLARRVKSVAVQISVQVTDAGGNRQTIIQNGTLKTAKTV